MQKVLNGIPFCKTRTKETKELVRMCVHVRLHTGLYEQKGKKRQFILGHSHRSPRGVECACSVLGQEALLLQFNKKLKLAKNFSSFVIHLLIATRKRTKVDILSSDSMKDCIFFPLQKHFPYFCLNSKGVIFCFQNYFLFFYFRT